MSRRETAVSAAHATTHRLNLGGNAYGTPARYQRSGEVMRHGGPWRGVGLWNSVHVSPDLILVSRPKVRQPRAAI